MVFLHFFIVIKILFFFLIFNFFLIFIISYPEKEAMTTIYSQILDQHLTDPTQKMKPTITAMTEQILHAALFLHEKISATFLPTAVKFHYTFNLRDLSNIFQVQSNIYYYLFQTN